MATHSDEQNQAEKVSVSLYPRQLHIVRTFAEESHRPVSNAIQFIIEDWARQKRDAIQSATPEQGQ